MVVIILTSSQSSFNVLIISVIPIIIFVIITIIFVIIIVVNIIIIIPIVILFLQMNSRQLSSCHGTSKVNKYYCLATVPYVF